MKEQNKVMSAELFYDNNNTEKTTTYDLMEQYTNYILSQRIDELAERVAKSKIIKVENYKGKHNESEVSIDNYTDAKVDEDLILKIANDFKTELNLQSSK